MATPVNLEFFEEGDAETRTMFLSADRLIDLRKQSFERGHAEGFLAATSKTKAIEAEVAEHLIASIRDISFTHIEARRAVLNSLEPLLIRLVEIVMPVLSKNALADMVITQATALAEFMTDGTITVTCAPVAVPILTTALAEADKLSINAAVVSDPTCTPGEVRITSPEGERHIDLDQAVNGIRDSVMAYYQLMSEEINHAR
ncbi:MAG: hypothetical protein KDA67_12750 [Rhodobacteraceae bacterium]|nr:hypothetical protein [Paracoccaceae bacterium]